MLDILDGAVVKLSLDTHLDIYIALSNDLSGRISAEIEDFRRERLVVEKAERS